MGCPLNPGQVGAASELRAAAYLIDRGYYVFRNVAPNGPVDLLVMDRDGNVTMVDVKTGNGGAVAPGVQRLMVRGELVLNDDDSRSIRLDERERLARVRESRLTKTQLDLERREIALRERERELESHSLNDALSSLDSQCRV